jgi:predicted dehydrogenase
MSTLRIGTLGAAKITPSALVRPSRQVPGVEVAAVAARDRARAEKFAAKHGIGRVHDSYEALLADPDIDAIYNPLPNALHGIWTRRALAAGKHVLCEKPFTANAAEAEEVASAAEASGLVVMEAFHWRYHPLAERMIDVVGSGVLGPVRHIETWVCFPLPVRGDIRYRLDMAGGATMDAGCYAINMLRTLGGAEPAVVSAHVKLSSPGVDRAMTADLRFEDGRTARVHASMFSSTLLRVAVRVVGDEGRLDVFNPLAPQLWNRLTIRASGVRTSERVRGDATYTYQLRAFVAAVTEGAPVLTAPSAAVANMAVIDAVYRAAGLPVRTPTPG